MLVWYCGGLFPSHLGNMMQVTSPELVKTTLMQAASFQKVCLRACVLFICPWYVEVFVCCAMSTSWKLVNIYISEQQGVLNDIIKTKMKFTRTFGSILTTAHFLQMLFFFMLQRVGSEKLVALETAIAQLPHNSEAINKPQIISRIDTEGERDLAASVFFKTQHISLNRLNILYWTCRIS